MNPDLERLIRLQELDDATELARRQIEEIPGRLEALDARLASAAARLAAAKQQLADNQSDRRAIEKDLAFVQGRLSKFKDQLMEVKTNKEYQAMQKEIATAESEVRVLEDRILERLVEADDLAATIKQAEADAAREQIAVGEEQTAVGQERATLERQIEQSAEARQHLVAEIKPSALALFEHVLRLRRGTAVAEARGGHCTACHVRLRPQVFNDVRRNDALIQCESCRRILYFASAPAS